MQQTIKDLISNVKDNGAHIFYAFKDQEIYIDNVIAYVNSALELGNHVMIIENDRIIPIIQSKLDEKFEQEQLDMVHTINNYDFYCYRGNFHKETILSYLENMIAPFLEKNIPIQTWAHVEWRDQEEIFQTLGEYEKEADRMLQATNLITICAYDANRVPQSLKEILMDCHDYYMTDNAISIIKRSKAKVE